METIFYFIGSILMVLGGVRIRIHLKKPDFVGVTGFSIFYLKFASLALIIFGSLSMLAFLVAFYLMIA